MNGPIYGVELIDSLPLSGDMRQAMPSADDLRRVAKTSTRTAAGYEVLLGSWRALEAEVERLKKENNALAATLQKLSEEGLEREAAEAAKEKP